MFLKLCKHELKCSYRSFLLLYAVLLLAAFIFNPKRNTLFAEFTVFFYGGMLFSVCLLCIVIVIGNYHKSMFTRNSYLTHTLPVSVTSLLSVKILSAVFWCFLSMAVIIVSGFIAAYRSMGLDWSLVVIEMRKFIDESTNFKMVPMAILITFAFLYIIREITLIYFCMNIAHTTHIKKFHFATAIFLYIVISQILNFILVSFGIADLRSIIVAIEMSNTYEGLFRFFTLTCFISIALTVIYFLASKYILEHKLEIK